MTTRRTGLWLIGACGGVGSTAALGLAALARSLTDTTSLVTAVPLFSSLDLDPFDASGQAVRVFVVRPERRRDGHGTRP